jgi:hypothetical protein
MARMIPIDKFRNMRILHHMNLSALKPSFWRAADAMHHAYAMNCRIVVTTKRGSGGSGLL